MPFILVASAEEFVEGLVFDSQPISAVLEYILMNRYRTESNDCDSVCVPSPTFKKWLLGMEMTHLRIEIPFYLHS